MVIADNKEDWLMESRCCLGVQVLTTYTESALVPDEAVVPVALVDTETAIASVAATAVEVANVPVLVFAVLENSADLLQEPRAAQMASPMLTMNGLNDGFIIL